MKEALKRLSVIALGVLAVVFTSCEKPATGLFVVISADPPVVRDLRALRVRVYASPTTNVIKSERTFLGPTLRLPLSFPITPSDPAQKVRIEVDGFSIEPMGRPGEVVMAFIESRVIVGFIANKVLDVPVILVGRCIGRVGMMACSPGSTCDPAGPPEMMAACTNAERPTNSLPEHSDVADDPCDAGSFREGTFCRPTMGGNAMPPPDSSTIMPPDAGMPPPADSGAPPQDNGSLLPDVPDTGLLTDASAG